MLKPKRKTTFLILLCLFIGFLVLSWVWQSTTPKKPNLIPSGDYTYTVEYADHKIHQLMKQHNLPSLAVALVDDQEVIWQEAFGEANIENDIPATTATVYKVWSIAKVFTAIETMRLVEDGLVDLDAPITDYVPDFSIQTRFPDSSQITIRSILAHHSGLPRNECQALMSGPDDPNVLIEMAATTQDCYMTFPVGYRYKYSNIGYDVLGFLIQELRGESFPHYMKENLLTPLGMENSAFLSDGVPDQMDIALGYEYYQGEYYPYEQVDITSLPSSNLYTTIEDMSAFIRFIFRGGETNGEQIIHPETLQLMFEDQYSSPIDPQPMGLGWNIAHIAGSELVVMRAGGPSEGIGSLVAMLPERKLGLVLIANGTNFDASVSGPLAIEILELMLESKYGFLPPTEENLRPIDIDPSLLADYEGKYIAFGDVMDVSKNGDRLEGQIQGMKFNLIPVGQNKFRVGHWLLNLGLADLLKLPIDLRELEIEFLVGGNNDEDLMIINMSDVNYEICPRYPEINIVPPIWEEITCEYEIVERWSNGKIGNDLVGQASIWVDGGVLKMSGIIGPILPINESKIIILSGSFAGETMVYEPETGYIYHQSFVYKPSN